MIKYTNQHIENYCAEFVHGGLSVCESIRGEYLQLLDAMNNDRYVFDSTEADLRIDFMQSCIRLTKSPFYGQSMILLPFQKAFISAFYGFKMSSDGLDRFRKALMLIPRKNAKSELCSALCLTELILGNPGSDIVCSSNDDSQASILYDAVDTMRLMIDPQQIDTWKNQKGIRNLTTNSKIFKLSERTRNKEGRNIDFAVIDESHEMQDNTLVKPIEQSQSLKANPKMIMITTEGFVNDGFLDKEILRARKIIAGEDDGISAERYLPIIYEQDTEQEIWQDRSSWIKSNPSLGTIKRWDYLDEQVDGARRSRSERVFVLSKDFNLKQNHAISWLDESDYSHAANFDIEDFRGAVCLGGVDLAETTDLACANVMMMKPDDPVKYILSHYFIPESKLSLTPDETAGAKYLEWTDAGWIDVIHGNDIDLSCVADWYYWLYESFGLRPYMVGYDQKFAKQFTNRMKEYGIDTEMIYQDAKTLNNAIRLTESDLQSRRINFNNNPVDRWCLKNASLMPNTIGQVLIVKPKNQATHRVDGAVCMAIVQEVYRRHRSEFHKAIA